jgi:hypothetical protein
MTLGKNNRNKKMENSFHNNIKRNKRLLVFILIVAIVNTSLGIIMNEIEILVTGFSLIAISSGVSCMIVKQQKKIETGEIENGHN